MGFWIFQIWLLTVQVSHLRAESPEKLASRLISDSCNADNFTSFYLHVRDMQKVARRYPPWPNGEVKPLKNSCLVGASVELDM